MAREFFAIAGGAVLSALVATAGPAQPAHGIAMYGDPALPQDFVALPYANPDAPTGGRVVMGEVGGFDSLNPHILKGSVPWQLRFLTYESLMGRSWDEPFTLYGLLAESVETDAARSWVEFTLRPEARFSDGTPVTVEDVMWSYETLGTEGHPRYLGAWSKVASMTQTGPRSVRFTFTEPDRELALIMGMRPILKKAQWADRDFGASGLDTIPISTAPYVIEDFEAGRSVTLRRDPDYWGADLPLMAGQANLDEIRMEFYGDGQVLFEAFKAGEITAIRESNAEKWETQYDFPAVRSGAIELSVIENARPTGMIGFVMNTRRAIFADWRVREAMIQAFNFEFINEAMTGGRQERIASYYANSELGMIPGAPARGRVRALLAPFAADLPPGALEGYALPEGDGTLRNRKSLRRAIDLLEQAGWTVQDGALRNAEGQPFAFEIVLGQGSQEAQTMIDLYVQALARLGIDPAVTVIDAAQYAERQDAYDFDMTYYQRGLSLSPGNEQRLYFGAEAGRAPGSRNLMGMDVPAAEAMIDTMLEATDEAEFEAAVKALDRVLMAGRYVIPIYQWNVSRIAHDARLTYPEATPIYGDWIDWMPMVWWWQEDEAG